MPSPCLLAYRIVRVWRASPQMCGRLKRSGHAGLATGITLSAIAAVATKPDPVAAVVLLGAFLTWPLALLCDSPALAFFGLGYLATAAQVRHGEAQGEAQGEAREKRRAKRRAKRREKRREKPGMLRARPDARSACDREVAQLCADAPVVGVCMLLGS